jgi:hypothetical protein
MMRRIISIIILNVFSFIAIGLLAKSSLSENFGTLPLSAHSDWQELSFAPSQSAGLPRVYLREWNGDSKTLSEVLAKRLPQLLDSPFWKDRLPEHWSLLLDGSWTTSAGYWSPDLPSPDKSPAILIRPQTLIHSDHGTHLIAHELAHHVHHQIRPHEESWIREGIAMMAEYLTTQKLNPILLEGFRNPETSLIAPLDPSDRNYKNANKRVTQYGHILQYFYYLYKNCGGDGLIEEILTDPSPQSGIELLDQILKRRRKGPTGGAVIRVCENFQESFINFEIARLKQDPTESTPFIIPTAIRAPIRDSRQELPPYSATAYRGSCTPGDIGWGAQKCIRIRME